MGKHMIVPIIINGMAGTAGLIRVMRGSLLDELKKPYVETARAKGLSEKTLLLRYPVSSKNRRNVLNQDRSARSCGGKVFIRQRLHCGGVNIKTGLSQGLKDEKRGRKRTRDARDL